MLALVIAGLAIAVVCIYFARRNAAKNPSPTQAIAEMESRLSQLQNQLDSLPDDEVEVGHDIDVHRDPEKDAVARDWAATEHGPAFDTGLASINLRISYRDGDGTETERDVIVQRYRYGTDGGTLSAFCQLRNERRTFLFHRITRAIDPATGDDIRELGKWLDATYASSPQGKAQGIIDTHLSALLALLYVARADGAFRAKEREIVLAFLELQDVALDDADVVVGLMPKWTEPSAVGFGKLLTSLAVKPEPYRIEVLDAALRMVASDKSRYPQEDRALKRMQAALSKV